MFLKVRLQADLKKLWCLSHVQCVIGPNELSCRRLLSGCNPAMQARPLQAKGKLLGDQCQNDNSELQKNEFLRDLLTSSQNTKAVLREASIC